MNIFNSRQYRTYENLIERLYRCSSIQEMEFILINDINQLVPSDSSIILFYEDDGITARSSIIQNLDPSRFVEYKEHYQHFDFYKDSVHNLQAPPAVNRASDFLDYTTWGRNEHRADFLLPQGIYHIACLEIITGERILASLSLHRDKGHYNFDDRELNILQLLVPLIKTGYQHLKPVSRLSTITREEKLTVRERQILPLLCSGHSNEELTLLLGISINTLKTHIKHILRKFDCSSRLELAALKNSTDRER